MNAGRLDSWLAELANLHRYRASPDLGPLRRLLAKLPAAPWLRGIDAVKVTGSNGKGSVAAATAAILSAAGVRTGLFVSPHVQHFTERLAVDGRAISEATLAAAAERLEQARRGPVPAQDELLAFEAITALAMEAFAAAEVETVVAEAGIGGRHDATRLLPGRLCGLVSLDLEHRPLLGDSLAEIGRHKADIATLGDTLMLGALADAETQRLMTYGRRKGVEVVPFEPGIEIGRLAIRGAHMELDLRVDGLAFSALRSGLLGEHQAVNCGLAIRLARHWLRRHRPASAEGERFRQLVHRALPRLRLPGRAEQLGNDPVVLVDTAHTPAALLAWSHLMGQRLAGRPWLLVCGVSEDKSPADLLSPFLGDARPSSLARPRTVVISRAAQRGGDPRRIAHWLALHPESPPHEVSVPLERALQRALETARREGWVVVVSGGLFLVAEARRSLLPGAAADAWSYY